MDDGASPAPARPLRPKERAVRRLLDAGLSESEVAWRFRRSPGHIARIAALSEVPFGAGQAPVPTAAAALERTVVRNLADGASHAEVAARLRRSPEFVARVEHLAEVRSRL